MKRGPLLATLGWFTAATLTTATTTWAITLLGQGLSEPVVSPMSASQIAQALATATPATPPGATTPPTTTRTPTPEPSSSQPGRAFTTQGGTVVATCTAGRPTLLAWSPAQGYKTDDVNDHSGHEVSVEFESETVKIEIRITCTAGVPSMTTKVERD
ncbi:hypothetical protein GCM10009677_29340 [Sphaerisporangium rubeum]|uniref:Septum formation initiator n=1 Tax=Sphaerisporangium rubeum TaxID=321317 RepID=A0A7X0IEF2_9ACTN|nr:hypothetical protein [Sphaerisporangium rubeum]MBB6473726.1 hypothetical protein [Sphaerisporangium rubeum]